VIVSATQAPDGVTTMRAARLSARRGPEEMTVERVDRPALDDHDVLVEVHAAAITPAELWWEPTWTNSDGTERAHIVPSHEVAGVVAALGPEVTDMSVGARVFGLTDFHRDGAAAEYVAVRADDLADWPASLDPVPVAALPLSGLTAWQALFDHGHLMAGQRVLVHGAAGDVGAFVVQLAHHEAAHVTAVASAGDLDYLRNLGADVAIDQRAGFGEIEPASMDLIVDTVGGEVLENAWPLLAAAGRLVSIAPSSRGIEDREPRGHFFIVTPDRGVLDELVRLLESNDLRVIVERTFSLDQARQAYEFGQREHPRGKVVLLLRADG
jgi:NADPH:quinone reductase-like Zn-dependent oxidoreductase